MEINGNTLPARLNELLRSGAWTRFGEGYSGRWNDGPKVKQFKQLFRYVEDPLPQLFGVEAMERVNTMWLKPEIANIYKGSVSKKYSPGSIDPMKTVVIGESEPDSPIALDFRGDVPRVIYFCDIQNESVWVEACNSIDVMISALNLD